jgi:pyrroloquinoline-quinone synthase
MDSKTFLKGLRRDIERHPGVNHPLLGRVAQVPFTREDYKVLGLQHYPLVGNFTTYLELLLLTAPDSESKTWLAKVLVDEYGEGSDGKDHATVYREYLTACGVEPGEEFDTLIHDAVGNFMTEHMKICQQEPFLVGLGAVGPGHEWSIPKMFPMLVKGLRRAGFEEDDILYFTLHMEQDIDHGLWLEEALERLCDTPEAQVQVRRGAMLSLEARRRFWSGVQDKIVRWRQPQNVHLRTQAHGLGHNTQGERTLRYWRQTLKKLKSPQLQDAS